MAAVSAAWRCQSCGAVNPEGTRFCGQCGDLATRLAQAAPTPDINAALRKFVDQQVADRLAAGGGRLTEERRLVTALFADISGFTPLADRLDPEQLLDVIDPIISRLSSVVGRYEGYVDKFAGDALLAFFGAPVSHEDDAVRALLVALDMHREMRAMLKELQPDVRDLTLHVGVNTGHVVARVLGSDARLDYSVLGDAVILAQRLESVAPGGATYVGEATYRLTAHRFEFHSVGDLTLKGKAQPVPAWQLSGEATHPARLPAGSWRIGELVGREAEVRSAAKVLDMLRRGTGGVLAVAGEPGVGKSRLMEAIHQDSASRGVRWLECRCLSYGAGLPYWPYADLLRRLFDIHREMSTEEALERLRVALNAHGLAPETPFIARLIGLPGGDAHGLEPEALQRRINTAVASLFKALAQEVPTVLCLEDIHWIDSASAALTAEIARVACVHAPFLFLPTGRPEARHRMEEIVRSIADCAPLWLDLEPLDAVKVTELVASKFQTTVAPELIAVLMERTGGNPFFVEEIMRSLLQTGALIERAGRLTLPPSSSETVPETVEGVIAARIDRLPHSERAALQTGAVIGRRIRRRLLQAVAEVPDVDTAVERLIDDGFLDREPEVDSVLFHHALTQEVAYGQLLRKRRRQLHQRIGEATEDLYGAGDDVIDLLARHFYLGEGGLKALEYQERAADRAKRLFANEEAILHLRHAEELARRDGQVRGDLTSILLSRAELEERVGSYAEAYRLYEEAQQLRNDVAARRGMAATLRSQGKYTEGLAVVEEGLKSIDSNDARPLYVEKAWMLELAARYPESILAAEEGLALAKGIRDSTAGELLIQLTRSERLTGRVDDALEHGREAKRILEEQGDLPSLVSALRLLGDVQVAANRLDDAAETLAQGLQLAERVGKAAEIGGCLINMGLVALSQDRLNDAIDVTQRALEEFERIGNASGRAIAHGNLADAFMRNGQADDAERHAQLALEIAQSIGHSLTIADVFCTTARIRMHRGDFDGAARQAEQAADLFLSMGIRSAAADAFALAMDASERSGDHDRSHRLSDRAGDSRVHS